MYRWVEHTSELELAIDAPTEDAVYGDALAAMAELLGEGEDGAPAGPPTRRELDLQAAERSRLLAAFLGEVAFLAETEGFVPERLDGLDAGATRLRAVLHGRTGDPPPLVKAVTYHRLAFAPGADGWHATAVLDV